MQSLLDGKVITFWLWPNCTVLFCPALFDLIWPSYSVTIETTRNTWGTAVRDVFSLIPSAAFLLLFHYIFVLLRLYVFFFPFSFFSPSRICSCLSCSGFLLSPCFSFLGGCWLFNWYKHNSSKQLWSMTTNSSSVTSTLMLIILFCFDICKYFVLSR